MVDATTKRSRRSPQNKIERRMLIRVSIASGNLIDLVCKFSGRTKRSLITTIFAEGMKVVLGVDQKLLDETKITLPLSTQPTQDMSLKELTTLLCGSPRRI